MPRPPRRAAVALATVALMTSAVLVGPGPGPGLGPGRAAGAGPAAAVGGTMTVTGPAPGPCPTSFQCSAVTVECADDAVPDITGRVAVGAARRTQRGVVVLFGGGGGMDYWGTTTGRRAWVKDLRRTGFETVEVAWDAPWSTGTTGLAALSCRPAAAIAWAAGVLAGRGLPATRPGVCGLCVVGLSQGATQATHPLAFHGVGPLVDAVVPMAGPPSADIPAGCRRDGTGYQFAETEKSLARSRIDDAWDGADPGAGPCEADPSDPSWEPVWAADGVATAGERLFPSTRFHHVWGVRDSTGSVGQGIAHLAALAAAGTPMLDYACISANHDVAASAEGLAVVKAALRWRPVDGSANVPPVPEAGTSPRCPLTGTAP